MSKKKAPPARASKNVAARSATRNTDSAPGRAPSRSSKDPAVRRAAETNETADAMPFNAGKHAEFCDSAADVEPVEGQHVPASDLITGSTLSETNVSDKTGAPPSSGDNPMRGPLTRVRVSSDAQRLTTNQGVPIADNQNSLKAGLRGPALLEDFILREKITHFDHERIPERIVHARGSGAHGFFECYEIAGATHRRGAVPEERASEHRSSCASRPSRANAARPTRRATCAASP